MRALHAGLRRLASDEDGATAIEYGLIAALIAVGVILAMTSFGDGLTTLFNMVSDKAITAFDNAGAQVSPTPP
jgi:pilus assembly protein Flp/PilA